MASLAGIDRHPHRGDLFRRLDHPGVLEDFLAVDQRDPGGLQAGDAGVVELIDAQPPVGAVDPAHQRVDLVGESGGLLRQPRPGPVEEHRFGRANLVDGVEAVRQVPAGVVVEQHHRPLHRHEQVAGGVVQGPHLHVGDVGGVADIDRIEQQTGGDVALAKLVADPLQAVGAKRFQVHPVPRRIPIGHRRRCRRVVLFQDFPRLHGGLPRPDRAGITGPNRKVVRVSSASIL